MKDSSVSRIPPNNETKEQGKFDIHAPLSTQPFSEVSSQVCIITPDGELIERRIKTDREHISELLGSHPSARIIIESGTESEWVARHLEALGHEVVVADQNFAPMYATPFSAI